MPLIDLKRNTLATLLLSSIVLFGIPKVKANSDSAVTNHMVTLPQVTSREKHLNIYQAAENALKKSQTTEFNFLLNQLSNHPLVDYLHRDWLIKQLSSSANSLDVQQEIKSFLKRNHDQVVSRKLRFYWLNYLSDTKQHRLFEQFYQPQRSYKLRCHYLWLQLKQSQPLVDLSPKIEKLWLTGKSLPKQCDPLFTAWKQMGELTEPLVWQRMQLAADNKQFQLVRYLTKMLSDDSKQAGRWLERISRNPARLKQKPPSQLSLKYTQAVIFKGLKKLAWRAPEEAVKLWKHHYSQLKLSATEKSQLQRAIGLSLAINGSSRAESWLNSVGIVADHSVKQWLLSSRLSQSAWSEIHDFTRQNTSSDSSDKWQFWNAIANQKLGNTELAGSLLAELANKRSYYGFLAAASLKKSPKLNHSEVNITDQEIIQLTQNAAARRAKALLDLGRHQEARSEWNHLLKSLPKSSYLAAAHLAYQWDWNHQSILAFARSRSLNDVKKRFPLVRIAQYQAASTQHNIPISWAYAITRQESAFKKDATSSAGAQGLMQLKPSTARLVARKKLKDSPIAKLSSRSIARQELLHQPELNINLGVAHLKQMLDYYDGNHILATAAYNAGSSRVDSWLQDNDISHSITWIEQIPFKETREYVKNVLTYQEIYAEIISDDTHFIRNINQISIPTNNKTGAQLSAR